MNQIFQGAVKILVEISFAVSPFNSLNHKKLYASLFRNKFSWSSSGCGDKRNSIVVCRDINCCISVLSASQIGELSLKSNPQLLQYLIRSCFDIRAIFELQDGHFSRN